MWRAGLRLIEAPYTWTVRLRNRRYDSGRAEIHRAGVPVVSVGNLTLGGTGKTPMVEWLARWFRKHDLRVVVISRGYGAEAGSRNDEALELKLKLPDVPHLQHPDRVAAAKLAVDELGCQLIVLDDAMQHRRIGRDLEIVLLDALEPFGFDHVFPRGTLREPLSGLRRADVVAISRADMLRPQQRDDIWRRVELYAPHPVRLEVTHAPRSLISAGAREEPLDALGEKPVAAFCGIGNPAGFRHTLHACGYRLADFREFPDHHPYSRQDVESLCGWVDRLDAAAVLCTHKDLVKLGVEQLGGHPLWAVVIGLEILAGEVALAAKLRSLFDDHREQAEDKA